MLGNMDVDLGSLAGVMDQQCLDVPQVGSCFQ